eukprot:403371991
MANTNQFSNLKLFVILLFGVIVRQALYTRVEPIKRFVFFNTPLIDIRQLKDCFTNYKISGSYILDQNSINQPLLLIKFYHFLYENLGQNMFSGIFSDPLIPIRVFLSFIELLTLILMAKILIKSYELSVKSEEFKFRRLRQVESEGKKQSNEKNQDIKDAQEIKGDLIKDSEIKFGEHVHKSQVKIQERKNLTWILILAFVFNPLSVLQGPIFNLQIVNHFLIVLIVYLNLKDQTYRIQFKQDVVIGIAYYIDPTLIYAIVPLRKIHYTLFNHSVFTLIPKIVMSLSITVGLIFLSGDVQTELRNYKNILFVADHSENLGFFWYIFVELKIILYQYPTLFDFNLLCFLVASNYKILRNVEGIIIILMGMIYCFQNVLYLWITWVERFSGNANFFYFQTIVYNVLLIIAYIQLFQNIDRLRIKFERILKNKPLIKVEEVN